MKANLHTVLYMLGGLIVENMDFFAQQPQLRILKKKKYSTYLGFIVTITIIMICFYQLYQQLEEILSHNNPNVVVSEQQVFNTNEQILYPQNQTIALAIVNAQLQAIVGQQRYFNITIRNCKRERIINTITGSTTVQFDCFYYPVEQCTTEGHFPMTVQQEFFKSFNKSALYCPSSQIWQDRPIKLQGTAQSDKFQYLDIQISECKNNTDYQGCASKEEFNKVVTGNYIILYTSDILSKMENSLNPFENIIQNQYYSYSKSTPKIIISNIKVIEVQTDQGLISKDLKTQFNLQQSTIKESYDYSNNQFWFQYEIVIDQKVSQYKRSYIKLQNVFGSIGGLWQILILSIQIIINPITALLAQIEIANEHFRFQKNENKDQSEQINQLNKQDLQISGSLIVNDEIPQQKQSTKRQYLKQKSKLEKKQDVQNYLQNKNSNYRLQSKDILKTLFCYNDPKRKQLQFALDKIMSKLDIFYIITKLQEIDKLKFLLLTKDQINLFNYIPKPIIPKHLFNQEFQDNIKNLEKQIAFKLILNEEISENKKINDAFKSFQNIKINNKASIIDQKILEFLDDEVRQLFESQCGDLLRSGERSVDIDSVGESQRVVQDSFNSRQFVF